MYRPDTPNLVRDLKEVGYHTGIIGKLHVNPAADFPFDMHEIPMSNFARKNLSDYARYAEAFINADDRPFLLSVNYLDAHAPWIKQIDGLPQQPLDADDVKALLYFGIDTLGLRKLNADYYNCLSRLDSLIGDLLAALQRSGKVDNTLIVYLGDHGAEFLRGKRISYGGGVRIPLIIYRLMRRPPRFELYDLQTDPYEFRNLATTTEYAATLAELQQQIAWWREQIKDPLLNSENLKRLTREVKGLSRKQAKAYNWGYPDYFIGKKSTSKTESTPATRMSLIK